MGVRKGVLFRYDDSIEVFDADGFDVAEAIESPTAEKALHGRIRIIWSLGRETLTSPINHQASVLMNDRVHGDMVAIIDAPPGWLSNVDDTRLYTVEQLLVLACSHVPKQAQISPSITSYSLKGRVQLLLSFMVPPSVVAQTKAVVEAQPTKEPLAKPTPAAETTNAADDKQSAEKPQCTCCTRHLSMPQHAWLTQNQSKEACCATRQGCSKGKKDSCCAKKAGCHKQTGKSCGSCCPATTETFVTPDPCSFPCRPRRDTTSNSERPSLNKTTCKHATSHANARSQNNDSCCYSTLNDDESTSKLRPAVREPGIGIEPRASPTDGNIVENLSRPAVCSSGKCREFSNGRNCCTARQACGTNIVQGEGAISNSKPAASSSADAADALFHSFSVDILHCIFRHLDVQDTVTASGVCKYWRSAILQDKELLAGLLISQKLQPRDRHLPRVLGLRVLAELGVPHIVQVAADIAGNPGACLLCGNVAELRRESEAAVKYWKKSAKGGHPVAMFKLGYHMYKGDMCSLSRDCESSIMWLNRFRRAAEAILVSEGDGGELKGSERISDAAAADCGHDTVSLKLMLSQALVIIGYLCLDGEGTKKDNKEAVTVMRRAAELGNEEARRTLGWMYNTGQFGD